MMIFISYRHDDSRHITDRIYDRLVTRFGKQAVFKDVDSLPLGIDFRTVLEEAVSRCDVLLVVIGDRWLNITDSTGNRRLDDPNDFVRIELEIALCRDVPVIPLLVDKATMPLLDKVPESLHGLTFRSGTVVRPDPDFHRDMDRVIKACEECRPSLETVSGWEVSDALREQAAASASIEIQDRGWAANLGYGFAFYVYCSGNDGLLPSDYKKIGQMVAQPCQELGLQVGVLKQSAYSTSNTLQLGEQLTGELRLRNPHLACLFDFVWRVMLLLFSTEDNSSAPHHERQMMETTLTKSARNADLLDDYSRQVIQGLAWERLSAEQRVETQNTFIHWVHKKVAKTVQGGSTDALR